MSHVGDVSNPLSTTYGTHPKVKDYARVWSKPTEKKLVKNSRLYTTALKSSTLMLSVTLERKRADKKMVEL